MAGHFEWTKDIKAGSLVKCTSTKLKNCDFNSVYTVAELGHDKRGGWSGWNWTIRIEGSSHFVSIHNFGPVDIKEIRAEKIKTLNGESTVKEIGKGRKIDRNKNIEEKKFKLFEMLLSRWFTDRKNLEHNFLGWY